jgi:hypothetical protein
VRLVRLDVRYRLGIQTARKAREAWGSMAAVSAATGLTLEMKYQVNMSLADLKAQIPHVRPHCQRRGRNVPLSIEAGPPGTIDRENRLHDSI